MKLKKVLASGVIVASAAFGATTANAALIGAWDWATDGGINNGTATCDGGGTCSLLENNTFGATPSVDGITQSSILAWGTGSNGGPQSALQLIFGNSNLPAVDAGSVFGAPADPIAPFGPLITDGGWINIAAVVHYNNVLVSAGGSLGSADVTTTFDFSPLGVPPGLVPPLPFSSDLSISLNETLNEDEPEDCAFGNPNNTACDDIFTLLGGFPSFSFTEGGFIYSVSFQTVAGAGSVVDPIPGGFEVFTAETNPGVSVIYNQARIDSRAVPAPSALALLGLGLALVGWNRRRAAA
ncbi:THxN family PEP-CTERM protein [Congregibacter sp.]|uniref:THxN family PEP-CTERM protein n=1 Tax=Congregibacter sp. TaxID=2744308 RepID=UPI0039E3CEEA